MTKELEMVKNLFQKASVDEVVKLYQHAKIQLPSPEGYNSVNMCTTVHVYSPWDTPNKYDKYDTLLNNVKMHMIEQFASISPNKTAIELGVYKGGVTRLLLDMGFEVTAYDTFEGIAGAGDDELHKDGEFNSGDIERYIPEATLVKGILPGTLTNIPCGIGFAHFDLDVYLPTRDSLGYIWPHMADGGMIIFDDYGTWTTPGVKKAVDEFSQGEKVYLPTGQMLIIKRG